MADRAVYKSSAAEFLDDFFGGSRGELEAAYDYSLGLLEANEEAPLSATTEQLESEGKFATGIGTAADFDSHWLADAGRLAGQDVDRVMRYGYQEAIRLARSYAEPVPIETLWVTGASDSFEVHVCEGKTRVTVLLFIPLDRDYGSTKARSKSWVVRAGGADDGAAELLDDGDPPVVKVQRSGAPLS